MPVLAAIDVDQAPQRPITVGYDLALAHDETLLVLYVMPQETFDQRQRDRTDLPEEVRQQEFTIEHGRDAAADQAAEAVETALTEYDHQHVETRGRVGAPAEKILAAADEIAPRYIVVGGRNRSPVRQALFGSVSQTIMRNAAQPVVTLMEAED